MVAPGVYAKILDYEMSQVEDKKGKGKSGQLPVTRTIGQVHQQRMKTEKTSQKPIYYNLHLLEGG